MTLAGGRPEVDGAERTRRGTASPGRVLVLGLAATLSLVVFVLVVRGVQDVDPIPALPSLALGVLAGKWLADRALVSASGARAMLMTSLAGLSWAAAAVCIGRVSPHGTLDLSAFGRFAGMVHSSERSSAALVLGGAAPIVGVGATALVALLPVKVSRAFVALVVLACLFVVVAGVARRASTYAPARYPTALPVRAELDLPALAPPGVWRCVDQACKRHVTIVGAIELFHFNTDIALVDAAEHRVSGIGGFRVRVDELAGVVFIERRNPHDVADEARPRIMALSIATGEALQDWSALYGRLGPPTGWIVIGFASVLAALALLLVEAPAARLLVERSSWLGGLVTGAGRLVRDDGRVEQTLPLLAGPVVLFEDQTPRVVFADAATLERECRFVLHARAWGAAAVAVAGTSGFWALLGTVFLP